MTQSFQGETWKMTDRIDAYLVIVDQGGLFGAYLDEAIANRMAKAVEGVVARVPVVVDYRSPTLRKLGDCPNCDCANANHDDYHCNTTGCDCCESRIANPEGSDDERS